MFEYVLQIAFIEHRKEILDYISKNKLIEKEELIEAKTLGLLHTCNCCYDDEVLFKNSACCEKGCLFCKSCVEKSVEVAFGEGKLDFMCLLDCGAQFDLRTLQVCFTYHINYISCLF